MNPYHVLDVPEDADAKVIKAAYRKLAKTFHPDTEHGSEETFNKLKLAFDVLSNPDRRARYHSTGRCDASPVNDQRIRSFIQQTMTAVVEAVGPSGECDDPSRDNVRDRVILQLKGARVELNRQMMITQKKLDRVSKLLAAFKTTMDYDPIHEALNKDKARLEDQLRAHEDALELSNEAERLFQSYNYEVSPGPEGQFGPGPTLHHSGGFQFPNASTATWR